MRELIFAYLATRPEFAKPKSCRRKLVGPMRSYLWRHGGAQDGQWPDAPAHALTLIAERAGASEMLADFCARCGRCDWGVMTTPAELRVLSPQPDIDPDADHGR
jgi:hypothetical protein